MDVAVVGGDARFAFLAQILRSRGLDARAIGLEKTEVPGVVHAGVDELARADFVVLNSPVQTKLTDLMLNTEDVIARVSGGTSLIFAGPRPAVNLDIEGVSTYDLSQDEDFLVRNAYLTAEGAVCAAMNASNLCIQDTNCLVVGWGRIGKALTDLLVGIGADVTVASRSQRSRGQAHARGAHAEDTTRIADLLSGKQIIFSTPPEMVIDKSILLRANDDALIIDLASFPYGVDIDAANDLGLHAWREPGLPGKYCPKSAAKVLGSGVLEIIKKGGGEVWRS